MDTCRAGPVRCTEQAWQRSGVEGERDHALWRAERVDDAVAVDRQTLAVPCNVPDRARATEDVERLHGRIHLERARGEDELERQRMAGEIPDLVARHDLRCTPRARRKR